VNINRHVTPLIDLTFFSQKMKILKMYGSVTPTTPIQAMSMSEKKLSVVSSLLKAKYEILVEAGDAGMLECIWKNKPDQVLEIQFTAFDTWDKIKRKMDKLKDSDGICVVCCEQENSGRKEIKVRTKGYCTTTTTFESYVRICNSCCEFVCKSCVMKMDGVKCPVCRVCLGTYHHISQQEECECDE
jgi:hypothetical protein